MVALGAGLENKSSMALPNFVVNTKCYSYVPALIYNKVNSREIGLKGLLKIVL